MRKLILFLLICISAKVNAQVYQEMPQYGYRANRMAFDSTLQIPTTCGVPTLKSVVKTNKSGAIAYDSCNAKFYAYNPKTLTWSEVSGGGGGAIDTTSLSNRINLKLNISDTTTMLLKYLRKTDTTNKFVNRITRTENKDSIIYFVGSTRFAIKDSVGGNDTTKIPYIGANKNVNLGTNNITANAYFNGFKSMFAKNDTIVLSIDSTPVHLVKGLGGQAYKLPIATTLANGTIFSFNNNQSSGAINVLSNSIANTLVKSVPSGAYLTLELIDNTTATGIWDAHFQTPSDVSWSTNTLDYNGSITNATWNGNVVAINRGGTGSATQNFVDLTTNQTIAGTKTFSSNIKIPNSGSQLILQVNSDGSVSSMPTSTYPSPAELVYVKGVTSAIQTQINNKVNISDTTSLSNRINLKLNATDTASLSTRIETKLTNLDLLQLMSFGIKGEPYGITLANMSGQLGLVTNRLFLYPFNWNVSDTLKGVAFYNRSVFTNTATNYNGIAIYSLSGGTLTRVVFSANDGTFWNTTINSWKVYSITPTYLTKGIYFIGYQFSGTGTPTIGAGDPLVVASTQSPSEPPNTSTINPNGIKFSTFITNATATPPSSIAMSTTTAVVNVPYFLFF